MFGGTYLRREICVSKSIGLALQLEVNLPFFLLCFSLYLRAIFPPGPREAYIWRGDLTEGFLRYRLGGLIFEILRYPYSMYWIHPICQICHWKQKCPGFWNPESLTWGNNHRQEPITRPYRLDGLHPSLHTD